MGGVADAKCVRRAQILCGATGAKDIMIVAVIGTLEGRH